MHSFPDQIKKTKISSKSNLIVDRLKRMKMCNCNFLWIKCALLFSLASLSLLPFVSFSVYFNRVFSPSLLVCSCDSPLSSFLSLSSPSYQVFSSFINSPYSNLLPHFAKIMKRKEQMKMRGSTVNPNIFEWLDLRGIRKFRMCDALNEKKAFRKPHIIYELMDTPDLVFVVHRHQKQHTRCTL